MDPVETQDGIEVMCPHCGDGFRVPKSMANGIANCPRCGQAVSVPGGVDTAWIIVAIGTGTTLAAAAIAYAALGWVAAVVALVICVILTVVFVATLGDILF